jgi:hypothetical protein
LAAPSGCSVSELTPGHFSFSQAINLLPLSQAFLFSPRPGRTSSARITRPTRLAPGLHAACSLTRRFHPPWNKCLYHSTCSRDAASWLLKHAGLAPRITVHRMPTACRLAVHHTPCTSIASHQARSPPQPISWLPTAHHHHDPVCHF